MKKLAGIYSLLLLFGIILQTHAQDILTFEVVSGSFDRLDCPISLNISPSQLKFNPEEFQLIEYIGNSRKFVPSQFDNDQKQLWFILSGFTSKNMIRSFAIVKKNRTERPEQIAIQKKDGGLIFSFNNSPILKYQYEIVLPPKGIDIKYKKSGFIHPVWSAEGEVLTRIQPPDHYHHYGIWGPWTKTRIGDRHVDFWNLGDGQGTVLFKRFLSQTQGDVFSGFTALQEHIDFGGSEVNRVAINEDLEVKIWNLGTLQKYWLIDYNTTILSPLKDGILFDAYRYGGGIGFRATEQWHKSNSTVLTSENKDRLTADGSSAKWVIIEGETKAKKGRSGILFMGFPTNREFPEPMRVWPINSNNGRGDMFFEFCPIRYKEWKIEGQKQYSLNYRMLIFDGILTAEQAEIYWQGFANPPKTMIKLKK